MTPDALVEKIITGGGRGMRSNIEKTFTSGKSRGAYDARLGAAAQRYASRGGGGFQSLLTSQKMQSRGYTAQDMHSQIKLTEKRHMENYRDKMRNFIQHKQQHKHPVLAPTAITQDYQVEQSNLFR